MPPHPNPVTGVAAGVPFLAVPPAAGRADSAAVVVAWHLMDPPRTEAAFAAALPLEGLDAWRIYLGLPNTGSRMPAGGPDELMRLGYEDAVLKLQGPIAVQGAEEFPGAFRELCDRLGLAEHAPLALVGGSMGSAIAQLVLAESAPAAGIAAGAAVLISPMAQLRPAVEATGRRFGVSYPWGPASLDVAARLDFVARADEIARSGAPAVRLIVGAADDADGFLRPSERLRDALLHHGSAAADVVVIDGMGHALADEPGVEPAPQSAIAAKVDRCAVEWLETHLVRAEG